MMTLRGSFEGLDKALQQKASESGGGLDKETVDQAEIDFRTKEGLEEFSRECIRLFKDGYEVRRALGFETPRSGGYTNEQADGNFPLRMQYAKLKKGVATLSKKLHAGEEIDESEIDVLRSGYNHLFDYRDRLIAFAKKNDVNVTEDANLEHTIPSEIVKEDPEEVVQITSEQIKRNEIEIHSFKMQTSRLYDDLEKLKNSDNTNIDKISLEQLHTELVKFSKRLGLFSEEPSKLTREEIASATKKLSELRALMKTGVLKEGFAQGTSDGTQAQESEPSTEIKTNSQEGAEKDAKTIRSETAQLKNEVQELIDAHPAIIEEPEFEAYLKSLTQLHNYLYDDDAIAQNKDIIASLMDELQTHKQQLQELTTKKTQNPVEGNSDNQNDGSDIPKETVAKEKKFPKAEAGSVEESLQQQLGFQDAQLKRLEEQYGVDAVRKTGDYMVIDGVKLKLEHHFKKTNTDEFDITRVQELLAHNSANIGVLQRRLEKSGASVNNSESKKAGNTKNTLTNASSEGVQDATTAENESAKSEKITYSQICEKKEAWKNAEDAWKGEYTKYLENPQDNRNFFKKIVSQKGKEKPQSLLDAEKLFQKTRAEYAQISHEAHGDAFDAAIANSLVLNVAHKKAEIEGKYVPTFVNEKGERKIAKTYKHMQEAFAKKDKGTLLKLGAGSVSAVLSGAYIYALQAAHESKGITHAGVGAMAGASGGFLAGEGYSQLMKYRRNVLMKNMQTSFDVAKLQEAESSYERRYRATENAAKVQTAMAVGGGLLGAFGLRNVSDAETDAGNEVTPDMPADSDIVVAPEELPDSEVVPQNISPEEVTTETSGEGRAGPGYAAPGDARITTEENQGDTNAWGNEEDLESGEITYDEEGQTNIQEQVPFEHTISETETVHDALVSAWKEHPEFVESPLSMEALHEKLEQLIRELGNSPKINATLMQEAHISSNDINLVYPNETIDLQPLFQHFNKYYLP